MNENEINSILGQELAKLGAAGGAIGGAVGGVMQPGGSAGLQGASGAMGGALGGAAGAKFASKRLPTQSYAQSITLKTNYPETLNLLQIIFGNDHKKSTTGPSGNIDIFSKVVGSGFFNMNPTLLIVMIPENSNSLTITAHAKEGLIKQKSAEKAVKSFIKDNGL